MPRDLYTHLVYARKLPLVGRLAYYSLKFLGAEIPLSVKIGDDFELEHGGFGVVIHSRTTIGNRVKVYPNVTIGRADIYRPMSLSGFEGVHVDDDVILCPGSKVLAKKGVLRVGKGCVLGANAVLLESTGENEIWAGIPAKRVGIRSNDGAPVVDDSFTKELTRSNGL